MKYVGDEVKSVLALTPQAISGSTAVYGSAFSRRGYESCTMSFVTGATANTPTNVNVAVSLQESDAEATGFTTVSGVAGNYSGVNASVPGQLIEINVDLKPLKRYVRAVVTPTFTGGSSPTVLVGGVISMGEAKIVPAS